MLTRRDFLRSGLLATSAGVVVPPILARAVLAAGSDGVHDDRVLVVLQMAGGNDGLTMLAPYADPAYHDARPTLAVSPDQALHLDAQVGLHPKLAGIKALYDAGRVAVVQGVGYDDPTYSHFEALHVWQEADPQRRGEDGWLGRLLASQSAPAQDVLAACALGEVSTPPELRAQGATVSVVQSAEAYAVQGGATRQAAAPALYRRTPGPYGALFDQALATAQTGIAALRASAAYQPAAQYGGDAGGIGASLQLAAQMIATQPGVKICHVAMSGFDTHQAEDQRQPALLAEVDQAVSAFFHDLDAHGVAQRVVMMTWSEFGRRVAENGSHGTDHGSAAPMLLIGAPMRGGLYGQAPSLTDLDNGNLRHTTDFRSVYQAVMQDWLGADAGRILGGSYPTIPLFQAA